MSTVTGGGFGAASSLALRRGAALLVGLLLLARLRLLLLGLRRVQLVGGLEGRSQPLPQRHLVELHRLAEERLGLARSPGSAHGRREVAVGEEVEPFAVGAPGRAPAVDAVAGHRRAGLRLECVDQDLGEAVGRRLRPREEAAVGGPGDVGRSLAVRRQEGLRLRGHVQQPEVVVVVGVGHPLPVGRRHALEAQDLSVAREGDRIAHAVRRERHELELAGRVGEPEQALAVGQEHRVTVAHARLARGPHQPPLGRGGHEDPAAGGEHHRVALRVEMRRGQVLHRLLDPLLPELVEVGGQADRQPPLHSRGDVVEPQVGAHLVDHPPAVEGGIADVPAAVVRVLPEVLATLVHRPQVHRAVAIAHEGDAATPPLRGVALAGVVAGQADGLGRALHELPGLAGRAAPVALRHVVVERRPHEVERLAGGVEATLAGLAQGQDLSRLLAEIERHELQVGEGGEVGRRVDELARGSPGRCDRGLALVGSTGGDPPGERHGVDLGGPLVAGGEGDGPAVGRDHRVVLDARVGREPLGGAPGHGHGPQVALGREDDRVAVDRRVPVEALAVRLGERGGRGQGRQSEGEQSHRGASCGQRPRFYPPGAAAGLL